MSSEFVIVFSACLKMNSEVLFCGYTLCCCHCCKMKLIFF